MKQYDSIATAYVNMILTETPQIIDGLTPSMISDGAKSMRDYISTIQKDFCGINSRSFKNSNCCI